MHLLTGFLVIAAVHGVTSFMVYWLPDAAVAALGLLGGNAASVDNYWSSREPVSYGEQLARLLHGDLGQTLDHSPVLGELSRALGVSAAPFAIGLAIALLVAVGALYSGEQVRRRTGATVDTLSLLPPFIFPFIVAPLLFASPFADSPVATQFALLASIVLPLAIMTTSMLLRFGDDADGEAYGRQLALNGLSTGTVARLDRQSAFSRLTSIFDRIVVAAIVSILLAEPLLGLSGIGTLSARAIRTADPNLTVAISTFIAVVVVLSGALSLWLRSASAAFFLSRRY